MDLADEMHLYWPVGARVVGHQGHQDFIGTITGHGDDGLTIITGDGTVGDGLMVLPWGVVVLIAAVG